MLLFIYARATAMPFVFWSPGRKKQSDVFFSREQNILLICLSFLAAFCCWAEARVKIARMNLTFKLDGNWSSFQLANSAPPLSVTDSAIAPSARMPYIGKA